MEWTRGPILGRGSAATVTAATSTSGDLFAVKSVDLRHAETLQKEQHFLSILKNPYVITYKGCDTTTQNNNNKKVYYNLFIEHMAGGSVTDTINRRNNGKGLTESEVARYTTHIVKGLEYIHNNGIVHCDIKGRNVLINEFGAKIGDFGCAKLVNEMAPICGTPMFMAPEVARGEEQGFPADVWAVGCTVIEMVTGGSPWPEVNGSPASVLYKIGFSGEIPAIPDGLSDKGKDFIKKCLIRDPKERWAATELLKHPFLEIQEINNGKVRTESADSPTSILDQDVWNSIKDTSPSSPSSSSSSSSSSVGIDFAKFNGFSISNSLRQRVEQLACKSEMVNWISEKGESDWITIRTNQEDEL